MSTSTIEADRPLRVVPSPRDPGDTGKTSQRDRRKFAAFLTAREILLGRLKSAGSTAAELLERWHLGGAVRMASRAYAWLASGIGRGRINLRTSGVIPAAIWGLNTGTGQGLVRRAGATLGKATSAAASGLETATCWVLRLFGAPGARAAERVQAKISGVKAVAGARVTALGSSLGGLLQPSGLVMQAVGTLAKGRVVAGLTRRFLPRPWDLVARAAANVLALPSFVRREALRVAADLIGKAKHSAPPATGTSDGPEDDTTPPAAAARVVDLERERANRDLAELDQDLDLAPSLQRHPAGRSQQAKRKR